MLPSTLTKSPILFYKMKKAPLRKKNGDLDAVGGGGGVAVVPHPQMALHLSGDVFSPC